MNRKEKYLYHQIHPLKLFTDVSASFGSLCLLWRHQLAFALVVMLAPPILVSCLLMRYADLEPYRQSAFGKYIARSMSHAMEAVRLAGMVIAGAGRMASIDLDHRLWMRNSSIWLASREYEGAFVMKYVTRYLILAGCWWLGAMAFTPATILASPTKPAEAATDKLHTPPEGSAEREAVLEGLRRHWQASRNPDGGTYRGRITFHVGYLKVHNGWAWVNAEPRSSVSKERFPENSGFLLRLQSGRWQVMKTPPMDDNGDGAFGPSPTDLERIKKMYPSIAADVIPVEKRR